MTTDNKSDIVRNAAGLTQEQAAQHIMEKPYWQRTWAARAVTYLIPAVLGGLITSNIADPGKSRSTELIDDGKTPSSLVQNEPNEKKTSDQAPKPAEKKELTAAEKLRANIMKDVEARKEAEQKKYAEGSIASQLTNNPHSVSAGGQINSPVEPSAGFGAIAGAAATLVVSFALGRFTGRAIPDRLANIEGPNGQRAKELQGVRAEFQELSKPKTEIVDTNALEKAAQREKELGVRAKLKGTAQRHDRS